MKVNCPTCQESVHWDSQNPFRPFCSKRCQMIDLGEWADEKHSIAEKQSTPSDLQIDPEDIEAMLANQPQDFFKD